MLELMFGRGWRLRLDAQPHTPASHVAPRFLAFSRIWEPKLSISCKIAKVHICLEARIITRSKRFIVSERQEDYSKVRDIIPELFHQRPHPTLSQPVNPPRHPSPLPRIRH